MAADDAPAVWYRTPWPWAFLLGVVLLTGMRPCLSRPAAPLGVLGEAPVSWRPPGEVGLVILAAGRSCTMASWPGLWKAVGLREQLDWRDGSLWWRVEVGAGPEAAAWWAVRAGADRLVREGVVWGSWWAAQSASDGAGVAQGQRDVEACGVALVDGSGRVRGLYSADTPEGRREVVHRLRSVSRPSAE
jgi:hypothetical protein